MAERSIIARSTRSHFSPRSAAQKELGNRVDRRAADARHQKGASKDAAAPRATHRRLKRPYETRVLMPSKLDPHIATVENWLAAGRS